MPCKRLETCDRSQFRWAFSMVSPKGIFRLENTESPTTGGTSCALPENTIERCDSRNFGETLS